MNLHLAHRAALSLRLSPHLHLRSSSGSLSLSLSALAFGARGPAGQGGVSTVDWADIVNKPPITDRQDFYNTRSFLVTHNMRKYVGFIVIDTGGNRWFPKNFSYPSLNSILIEFDLNLSGTVFLS